MRRQTLFDHYDPYSAWDDIGGTYAIRPSDVVKEQVNKINEHPSRPDEQTEVQWFCWSHAANSVHEVGCPHVQWTAEQLREALITKKRFE